jgi:hypothetical protein
VASKTWRAGWLMVGLAVFVVACGGPAGVRVSVAPAPATVVIGATQVFTATVTGASNASVTWTTTCGSLATGAATATLTASGAPRGCSVTATSVEDPTRSGQASVTLVAATGGTDAWARQVASAGYEEVRAVAVGDDGTVYAAGLTDGSPFGGPYVGGSDVFVVAYTADGDLIWHRQFGTVDNDEPTAIAVRPDGDVVVVGTTLLELFVPAPGGEDAFAVRLAAATGATVWSRQFGTDNTDRALAVALAADGDVYVGGWTSGSFPTFVRSGNSDAFLARLDGDDGSLQDVVQFGSLSVDRVEAIVVLPGGDVVVGGATAFDMPGSAGRVGDFDGFLRRFTPGFVATQTVQFGVAPSAIVSVAAMAIAPDGDLRIAGETNAALTADPHAGGRDVFVARVDPATLARSWTVQAGSSTTDVAHGLAVDADGLAFLAGATAGEFVEAFAGSERAILLRVDADGGGVVREQFGEGANTYATGVATAGPGYLVIGGWTNGPIGGLPAQDDDGFVLKRPY